MNTVKPYTNKNSKKEQVEQMFDNISHRYDLLNRLFSLGIDQRWRKKVVKLVATGNPSHVLDVATGTADLAILLSRVSKQVTGLDLSEGMLELGRKKVSERHLEEQIRLVKGDSEKLPFKDETFDAVTVAFGARNFGNLQQGVNELIRVIKPGGRLVVLEFSKPSKPPFKQLFRLYFHYLMPMVGKLVSGDTTAYTYLPESVDAFPDGQEFMNVVANAGGKAERIKQVTGGIATIYSATK